MDSQSNGNPKPNQESQEKGEAVCFTAGLEGAPFGAGVIHAYLAADRKAPTLVAGISMGALTSAAFQRAYRELKTPTEDARWQWYRRYLRAISENPLEVIWSGIPDQSDFFAEFNPVQDPVPQTIPDNQLRRSLIEAEQDARRDLTLFVKLGHWISTLPIKVGAIADVVIKYVRVKERYGYNVVLRYLSLWWALLSVVFRPLIHNAFHPQFINEASLGKPYRRPGTAFSIMVLSFVPAWIFLGLLLQIEGNKQSLEHLIAPLWGLAAAALMGACVHGYLSNKNPRPLFGWPVYGISITFCLGILLAGVWILAGLSKFAAQRLARIQLGPDHTTMTSFFNRTGDGLQALAGVLSSGGSLGLKLLFLIAFVATFVSAIRLIQKNGKKPRSVHMRSWARAIGSIWSVKFVRWTAYVLGGVVVVCAVLAATVRAFRAELLGVASSGRIHQAIFRVNGFNRLVWDGIVKVVHLRYWIIVALAFVLGMLIAKHGQQLSESELDSVLSAKLRRRPKLFACSLPAIISFRTWIWTLMVLLAAEIVALRVDPWIRFVPVTLLAVTFALLVQVIWQANGLRWRLKASKWIGFLSNVLFENLNLHKSLVHNYYLRLSLYEVFGEDNRKGQGKEEPILRDDPFPAVLVAAPLQVRQSVEHELDSYQVWAATGSSLIDALRGALAVPGLYEPVHLEKTQEPGGKGGKTEQQQVLAARKKTGLDSWWVPAGARDIDRLDIVDGTVIRQNPIPAFFNFIAEDSRAKNGRNIAERLSTSKDDPRVHVVYSVPIDPEPPTKRDVNVSIVDVGLAAAKLSRRRDTQLEVHQTNLLSQVEAQLKLVGAQSSRINPIFADEIAPTTDAGYNNPLSPTRDEVLNRVAAGCRATLEVIHVKELGQIAKSHGGQFVSCSDLMKQVSRRVDAQIEVPGLPEVCNACQKSCGAMLRAPQRKPDGTPAPKTANTWASLLSEKMDHRLLPQLSGEKPRIIFVASGGVFRGSFHAGMAAALLVARIKPDLIVGASVGTIMGGALAAAFSAPQYTDAIDHLEKLTSVLLGVDHQIAFTKPFKNAVRDLGIRAREVTISPNDVRKMVLDGSRDDAAFGVVGAPSALIDNISHLLLIPHNKTAEIAAEFIAGHVTEATKGLLKQLKTETLKRLNIEYALIGTTLIQPTATALLSAPGADLTQLQPFASRGIALYGTTIDFWRQRPVLLGAPRDKRGPSYNFIEAALCSSAFPCVFATRRESDLFPGTGEPTTLFSDGGMFDNLPFLPAVEILAQVQAKKIAEDKMSPGKPAVDVSMDALARRCEQPDLFIAGSLDVNLQRQAGLENDFENIAQITKRGSALNSNVKIKGYEQLLIVLDEQLRELWKSQQKSPNRKRLDLKLLDGIVNASVLPVYPADPEHLNGTFAFCASTGMMQGKLNDSIADGCFQTLKAFAESSDSTSAALGKGPLLRSIDGLKKCGKLPEVAWLNDVNKRSHSFLSIDRNGDGDGNGSGQVATAQSRLPVTVFEVPLPGECKYFKLSPGSTEEWFRPGDSKVPERFVCPFYQAAQQIENQPGQSKAQRKLNKKAASSIREIYERCITDQVHQRLRGAQRTESAPPPAAAQPILEEALQPR